MKINRMKQLMLIAAAALYLLSCTNDTDNGSPIINVDPEDTSLNINLRQGVLPDSVNCIMYVFSKANLGDNYLLKDSIHLDENHRRTLPYIASEWNDAYYRFLFIAISENNPGLTLTNHTNAVLTKDVDSWQDVRLTANDIKAISEDCYFGFIDKTNTDIASTRLISGNIKRLAGQVVLDIFRINDAGVPMDKVSVSDSSVIDRVFRIDFEYEGLTDQISFNDAGEPVMNRTISGLILDTMNVQLTNDLMMDLDDNNQLEISGEGVSGSVRIKGLFGLTSENNLTMKVTFHYYDTTPICGNTVTGHTHSVADGCFAENKLVLNLPQNNPQKDYLNILPNYYTVNKAGIWLDRIIDLKYSAALDFDTEWVNENVENN